MENIIILKQLPIIEERLAALSEQIRSDIAAVVALDVTDENVKKVKTLRAKLNKDFTLLEDQRKLVKNKVLEPYEAFEEIYKKMASDPYKDGLAVIDARVNEIESIQKQQKYYELKDYYDELCNSVNIEFIPMERWNPKIGLSTTLKSLKEQANSFISGIVDCRDAINDMENREEIFVEYKKSLNLAEALQIVKNRQAAIEEQKRKQEEADARQKAESETVAKVDAAIPQPTIESLPPPQAVKNIVSCKFYSSTTGEVYPQEYNYYCEFSVVAGQKVEVETKKGIGKAVVTAVGIDPASIKFDLSLMKNVLAVIRGSEEPSAEKDPNEVLSVCFTCKKIAPRHEIQRISKLLSDNGITVEDIRWEVVYEH